MSLFTCKAVSCVRQVILYHSPFRRNQGLLNATRGPISDDPRWRSIVFSMYFKKKQHQYNKKNKKRIVIFVFSFPFLPVVIAERLLSLFILLMV